MSNLRKFTKAFHEQHNPPQPPADEKGHTKAEYAALDELSDFDLVYTLKELQQLRLQNKHLRELADSRGAEIVKLVDAAGVSRRRDENS